MIDIDALEALAKGATHGPWAVDAECVEKFNQLYVAKGTPDDLQGRILQVYANCLVPSEEGRLANAEFIAAANPITILVLIAEARALRSYKEMARKQIAELMGVVVDIEQFGSGFDDTCMVTLKRVMAELAKGAP